MWQRIWRNVFTEWFRLRLWFPAATMRLIADAIAQGELRHAGELRFAVEARFSVWQVLTGLHARARAEQVFSNLRIWDTEHNSGVLLYLHLAEHKIEIIADRGIAARVPAAQWQALCENFVSILQTQTADRAVLACIAQINALLIKHFPADADNAQELSNTPVIL